MDDSPSDPESRMPRPLAPLLRIALAVAALLPVTPLGPGPRAAEVTVTMVTEGPGGRFRFEPAIVRIRPGDTVRFVAHDPIHATKSIPGMMPAGAAPWWGEMGAPLEVTFTVPGVYGFKCPSHYTVGMVGLIIVGDPGANLEEARAQRHPGMAQEAFDRLFARLSAADRR